MSDFQALGKEVTRIATLMSRAAKDDIVQDLMARTRTLEDGAAAAAAAATAGTATKEKEWKGFNVKDLKLDPYDGERSGYSNFALVVKQFVRKEKPGVAAALEKAELEMDELFGGSKEKSLSQGELDARKEEENLFSQLPDTPALLSNVADLLPLSQNDGATKKGRNE